MLTQCPNCQTTFRVTSEILRVAQGQVRCGRCQTQFDALERLIEETNAGEGESGRYLRPRRPAQPAPASGEIQVEEPVTHEDITLEGRHIEISGTYEVIDNSGRGEPQVKQEVVEEWVEIEDGEEAAAEEEPAEIDMEEEYAAEEQAEDDLAVVEAEAVQAVEAQQRATYEPMRRLRRAAAAAAPPETDADEADARSDFDLLPRRNARAATAPLWKILAVPLALLFVVQLVHTYRSTLARHPQLGPPLINIYSTLGLTLRPNWNLHAYEVRQWGVASDPSVPGTLKVRASVKNLASFAQPYPLLKLVLEDRWGDQVRARELEPAEYLDPNTAPNRLLAPAQQANATIAIVDPGPDAEGFRFDVCLRGASGPVCAADVPQR